MNGIELPSSQGYGGSCCVSVTERLILHSLQESSNFDCFAAVDMEQGSSSNPTSKKRKGIYSGNNEDGVLPPTNPVSPPNLDEARNPAMVYLIAEAIILQINPGEDIIARIRSFYEQAPDDLRIRSAFGVISSAVLGNDVSVPMTVKSMCEILSLSGSFGANENGIVTVSLANNEGRVIGGRVVGEMMAATLVTVELCRLLRKGNEDPCGYYFNPTEEDLIKHYLLKKIFGERTDIELKVIDLLKVEPSDIPQLCKVSGKETSEWYFYTQKDPNYLSGTTGTNRATAKGNWRTSGSDKEIYTDKGALIGMRKTLIFYQGKSSGRKITEWSIHEYRAENIKNEGSWLICKLFTSQRKTKADRPRLPPGALNIRGDQPVQEVPASNQPVQQVSLFNQPSHQPQGQECSVFNQIPSQQPLYHFPGPSDALLPPGALNIRGDQPVQEVPASNQPVQQVSLFNQPSHQPQGQECSVFNQIPSQQPLYHFPGPSDALLPPGALNIRGDQPVQEVPASNQPVQQVSLFNQPSHQPQGQECSVFNQIPSQQPLYHFPGPSDALLPPGALNIRGDQPVQEVPASNQPVQQVSLFNQPSHQPQGQECSVFNQIPSQQPLYHFPGPSDALLPPGALNIRGDQPVQEVPASNQPVQQVSLFNQPSHQLLYQSQGPGYHVFNQLSSHQPLHQDQLNQDQLNQMINSMVDPEWDAKP
ncbi:hypothetical protein P8452_40774 [Trifolium repens]|nr:hypothetical protein P8452_40774 [Trifolium repens]